MTAWRSDTMTDQIKGMTEVQVREFLEYVDAELNDLESSRLRWFSKGRTELAYNDKMELSRLEQTKRMFLKIMHT